MLSSPFFSAAQFIRYSIRSKGAHALHSPFLYDLYNQSIKQASDLIPEIESKRKRLRRNNEIIDVVDFKSGRTKRSTVGNVARTSLSHSRFSNFLRLMCDHLEIRSVVETGTSLGINALYLAAAKSVTNVFSIEGSDIIHRIANDTTRGNPKITLEHGNMYERLEMSLAKHQPELVFLDADHRQSAIEFCLDRIETHVPSVKCIVIHDIYWSEDMASAWNKIKENPKYALTVDIFRAGLIFPNSPIVKQDFTLKF